MEIKNILIVEDDHAIRTMMKDVLEVEGYHVAAAADGSEGIEQLKNLRPQPCVILLDLMMAGINGWNFLDFQRTNPEFANIPVVVCSAYGESARSVKVHGVLEKPIKLDDLLETVSAFCA